MTDFTRLKSALLTHFNHRVTDLRIVRENELYCRIARGDAPRLAEILRRQLLDDGRDHHRVALAADVISVALADQGIDCILSLGGDVAVGRSGDAVHPWPVSLSERPEGEVVETFTLTEGGVATSTTVHRTWTHQGRAVHHVLDPATGLPVQRTWRTVTVRAGTCLAANAASTASLVLGERADRWLTDRGFAARLVSQDGSVRTLGGWPDPPVEGQD